MEKGHSDTLLLHISLQPSYMNKLGLNSCVDAHKFSLFQSGKLCIKSWWVNLHLLSQRRLLLFLSTWSYYGSLSIGQDMMSSKLLKSGIMVTWIHQSPMCQTETVKWSDNMEKRNRDHPNHFIRRYSQQRKVTNNCFCPLFSVQQWRGLLWTMKVDSPAQKRGLRPTSLTCLSSRPVHQCRLYKLHFYSMNLNQGLRNFEASQWVYRHWA